MITAAQMRAARALLGSTNEARGWRGVGANDQRLEARRGQCARVIESLTVVEGLDRAVSRLIGENAVSGKGGEASPHTHP